MQVNKKELRKRVDQIEELLKSLERDFPADWYRWTPHSGIHDSEDVKRYRNNPEPNIFKRFISFLKETLSNEKSPIHLDKFIKGKRHIVEFDYDDRSAKLPLIAYSITVFEPDEAGEWKLFSKTEEIHAETPEAALNKYLNAAEAGK